MLACRQNNLGERARNRALRAGVLVAGAALGGFLLANEFGLVGKLGWFLALPLAAASYLIISGIFGICVVHGLKGDRDADHGRERLLNPVERSHLRTRALLVLSASILIALCFTAALTVRG